MARKLKVTGGDPPATSTLPAGEFSRWLHDTRAARGGRYGVDVACGTCTACCRSSYFVHIGPDETQTIARIPKELRFVAPGLPRGHVLLGYDEEGRCPMLTAEGCSIYEDRPLTCRQYDCRVFAATGLPVGGEGKESIEEQSRRWAFTYPDSQNDAEQAAVKTAARFLVDEGARFPRGILPANPTQLAMVAVRLYPFFLTAEGAPRARDDAFVQALVDELEGA